MTLEQLISSLKVNHDLVGIIDLHEFEKYPVYERRQQINKKLKNIYCNTYQNNQRLVIVVRPDQDSQTVNLLEETQRQLNNVDISNFFVIFLIPEASQLEAVFENIKNNVSTDPVPVTVLAYQTDSEVYNYNSTTPVKIKLDNLQDREKYLLTESATFCMYPWIHIHAYPTGEAYPCCHAEMGVGQIGNCKTQTLEQIWTGPAMQKLRADMLSDTPNPACNRCYEQEASGFFSGRRSANKHHGHHITKLKDNPFELIYWDIRFSNLCNLSCRSCGHIFSSSWYADQAALAGPEWKAKNTAFNYAGRTETDIWEQLIPHLDYVEQIYFAGGEPLMMEEHYRILDELERRGRFDVRLIYNTNFTHVKLKNRTVFDYWKRFDSVSVGASLDAMGARAEYIRNGTDWSTVEQNRQRMMEICPNVDFYISPTMSILNADHLPEFHKNWTQRGLIKAQDLNVNILQDPAYYRIDAATPTYKRQLQDKFEQHLEWLRPQDSLGRATRGFESAIKFMNATDNTDLLPRFWERTQQLDQLRKQNVFQVLPELQELQ